VIRGLLAGLAVSALWAAALPGADEIVKRSVANTVADWRAAPQYNFTERDVATRDGKGARTSRVILIDGSPYYKLIAVNGEPLTGEQAAQEERKYRQAIAERQHETPAQRRRRIAEYERERRQNNALMGQMTEAFDYRLVGEDTVNGRRCFVLVSTPKPGYRPTSRDTKVLTGMRGKLWVDERQFQWVKVEAEVFRRVAFGVFIAQVEPGTRFTLEQQPVQGNLWLPSHFSMQVNAKVLRLWSHNSTDDETYWNYQPVS
jgi:hypothetical protein